VILPHWEQRHPDHRVCSQLGFDACYFAGLKKAKLAGEPHRPRKIIYASYYRGRELSFAVDVTEQFERKLEAVKCYRSQFNIDDSANKVFIPGVDIFEYMRVRDRELGIRIGARFAEGYVQKELVAIDDPLCLGGVSI
jgi:LmbE family N-acetylglucosaminyl deacetylase